MAKTREKKSKERGRKSKARSKRATPTRPKPARKAAGSSRKAARPAKRTRRPRRHLGVDGPRLLQRPEADITVPENLVKDWSRVRTEPDQDYRIFRTRFDVSVHPRTKAEHRFVVLEGGDWVNVIPITPEGNVVFIEQYRHGIRANTLEVPGGMIDAGESPAAAAARELREETGYEGDPPVKLGWIHPNPAIQNNRCWSYVVRNARVKGPAHNEGTEDIAVVEVPLAQVPRLMASGRITHALVMVAFQWLWLGEGG